MSVLDHVRRQSTFEADDELGVSKDSSRPSLDRRAKVMTTMKNLTLRWDYNQPPSEQHHHQQQRQVDPTTTTYVDDVIEGVAVTVMLHGPKWFHRRYVVMIHNVLVNLPPTWKVQIFYNEAWLRRDVLPHHPGLQRLFADKSGTNQRIVWTMIPDGVLYHSNNSSISSIKRSSPMVKPKVLLKSKWFWESTMHENVFMFSGNGVLCGNHDAPASNGIARFVDYDYVGTPWGRHDGMGGNGETHSFRHKSAMLRILQQYDPATLNEMDLPDHVYFTQHMMKSIRDDGDNNSNNNNNSNNSQLSYRVADRNTTMLFGGIRVEEDTTDKTGFAIRPVIPFVVSGTQGSLQFAHREALLNVCPELKVIFPSLHEPGTSHSTNISFCHCH